ncbi:MAG: hypothetical protein M5R38_01690 [Candidatus Methylomirabilis sp.]|nr:hypothetical protein [Candidatus Methylomirabilis sp.]
MKRAAQPPTPNPPTPESPHALRLTPHDACGACRSCRNIAAGQHPDVQVIEPDGAFIKIEQIRTLEADAALVPYEAPWKVFILDSAERMTEQAANALLKTLEEPAKDTVFILLTSAVAALLPTIVSPVSVRHLYPAAARGDRDRVEETGDGAVAGAADCLLKPWEHRSGLEPGGGVAPGDEGSVARGIGRGLGEGPAALVELAEKLAKDRDTLQQQLEILSAWLRDLMVVKASGHTRWLVNDDRGEAIAGQAKSISLNAVLDGLRAVHAAMENITRNANPRLSMEDLLLRLRELLPSTLLSVSV